MKPITISSKNIESVIQKAINKLKKIKSMGNGNLVIKVK